MSYVASKYDSSPDAPIKKWCCTRTSIIKPMDKAPNAQLASGPNFCGQCVSFVTTVCPSLPVATGKWTKGELVKGNGSIVAGTVIATFGADDKYKGHAAIYVGQNQKGIQVYDQWVTGIPKAVGPRTIAWNGTRVSNNGDSFRVVE